MTFRPFLLVAASALLTACSDGAPKCAPVTMSQASVVADTVTTTTGLRYVESNVGTGTAVDWCQGVSISYDAYLTDGTLWDSSAETGAPYSFVTGFDQVFIKGLEQGTIGMAPGGSRHLIVPPTLGFGNNLIRFNGKTLIPPNSTLIFDITLVTITP